MHFLNFIQLGVLENIGAMEILLGFVCIGGVAFSIVLLVLLFSKQNSKRQVLSESPSDGLPEEDAGSTVPLPGQSTTDIVKQPPEIVTPEVRDWCVFIHVSQFCAYVAPIAGIAVPLALWLMKKEESRTIDMHGKIVMNWIFTLCIFVFASIVLTYTCCIGLPPLIVFMIMGLVYPIIGAVKAQKNEVWRYPLSIPFFRLD